jgi:osmotically-inducible protein OsmY
MKTESRRLVVTALATASTLLAAGCAPLVIGGAAAGTALVVSDRRSPGIQLEDQAIELRLRTALDGKLSSAVANIKVTSYNQRVLLTGEVTTEAAKAEAQAIAEKSPNVLAVRNEIHVGALTSFSNQNYDRSLTAKVTIALIEAPGVPSGTISVVSSRSIVYLMGLVTVAEGEAAARAASRVVGVRQVVKYFDYLSEKEAAATTPKAPAEPAPK